MNTLSLSGYARGARVRSKTSSIDLPKVVVPTAIKVSALVPVVSKAISEPVLIEHFWFLWNPKNRNPRKRQPSFEAAKAERTRLEAMFPGEVYHLYEAHLVVDEKAG